MLYQRNNRNATPLHFACYSEAIDNVLYMIQLGLVADVLVIEPPFDARSPLTSSLPIGPDSTKCIRNSRLNIVNETHQDLLPISARSSTINVETLSTQSSGSDDVNPKSSGSLRSPAKLIASNSIEIPFSNEMLEDLDVDDIKLGGSPLHWCMYRRTLERLLQYDLRLDAIDLNHETALFRCVSKHRLRCMLHLLNAGADPNLPNLVGNTCLHEAVMRADIPAVQALICWNCDVNAKNHDGHTARHLAAVANSKNHLIIVYVLYAIGAKRCEPNVTGCTGDCSATGTGSGQKFSKWADFQRPSPMEHYLNDWSILTKKESSKMKS